MSILEALWRGQLCPVAQADYRDAEYRALVALYERNEKKLLPTLNQQQQEDLQKMQESKEEMERIAECGAFVNGFRLAVQLMAASVEA